MIKVTTEKNTLSVKIAFNSFVKMATKMLVILIKMQPVDILQYMAERVDGLLYIKRQIIKNRSGKKPKAVKTWIAGTPTRQHLKVLPANLRYQILKNISCSKKMSICKASNIYSSEKLVKGYYKFLISSCAWRRVPGGLS